MNVLLNLIITHKFYSTPTVKAIKFSLISST